MSEIKWNGDIKPDHRIAHAFTAGETPYFNFLDTFNIPAERALDALHIYQEFKMRVDEEYLLMFCKAKQKLYSSNPINIFELKKLDDQLEEKIKMALPASRQIENLASVYYFSEEENPYRFDRSFAEEKIKKWRTEKIIGADGEEQVYDFFLRKRLQDFLPSSDLSDENLADYLKIADLMDWEQVKTIFKNISPQFQNRALFRQPWSISTLEKMSV